MILEQFIRTIWRRGMLLSFVFLFMQPSLANNSLESKLPNYYFDDIGIQDRTINGNVVDENNIPLLGVSILVEGTSIGTTTDFDGNYSISVPEGANTLVVSYVGYETKKILITGSTINISMVPDASQLDEVVVVGYGTQERKDVTGSIASIKADELSMRPITSVEEGMQGIVPGLNIAQRNASPGALSTVSIRGLGSITAGTEPLWVVDGFPTDQRNAQAINPSDIASVDVKGCIVHCHLWFQRSKWGYYHYHEIGN